MATPRRPRDVNQLAHLIGRIATGEETERPVEPSDTPKQRRASKGGQARKAALTAEQRREIARRAAAARWDQNPGQASTTGE